MGTGAQRYNVQTYSGTEAHGYLGKEIQSQNHMVQRRRCTEV